jgi:flagellar biosynthetic protein FliP
MPSAPPDLSLTPFLVVGAIALVAGAAVWWQRRRTGARPDDVIRLVATRALGSKRLLALVEVERERFLLGLTDDSITCVGRLASSSSDDVGGRDTGGRTSREGGESTWRLDGPHDDRAPTLPPATGDRAAACVSGEPCRRRGDAMVGDDEGADRQVVVEAGSREGQSSPHPLCALNLLRTRGAATTAPPSNPPPGRHAISVFVFATTIATLLLSATPGHAALPQLSLEVGGNGDGLSTSIQLMLLFTLLSFAPAILIGVSAFVRIVIVLAFVRQAVGTQQMPPNQVIVALALFLTFFVMMPTLRQVNQDAVQPYLQESTPPVEALERGFQPLRAFMLRQTREKDLALFLGISQHARPDNAADVPPEVVIPAFMISELKTAFQISFMVYIPFLVLDMVVASILTSMGMITLPPVLISLPFKLMIFVLVDGWNLLISSLIRSFQ